MDNFLHERAKIAFFSPRLTDSLKKTKKNKTKQQAK